MEFCCSVTSVFFVLVVHTKVVAEPNTMSDCIKAFLDDPQWPEHIEDPELKQIKRQISPILTENGDSIRFFLVNYSCSLKCIEKNLVNYRYFFGTLPRSEPVIRPHHPFSVPLLCYVKALVMLWLVSALLTLQTNE